MSVILLDTCVLTDLADPDSDWYEWSASTLEQLDMHNRFVINPVIYAECSVGYQTIEAVESYVEALGLELIDMPREALFLAGKAFSNYRKRKGSKVNVLPDFFIGAHAAVAGFALMTRDKGRFSTYFPSVKLILPERPIRLN